MKFIYLPLLVLLVACNGEDKLIEKASGGGADSLGTLARSQEDVADAIEEKVAEQNSESQEEQEESTSDEAVDEKQEESVVKSDGEFKFNKLSGDCLNGEGEKGHNEGFTECGDLSNSTAEGLNFKKKGYHGLNLEGTAVVDSKLKFGKMADHEIKVDEGTSFENKNSFTKLFDQHVNLINREQNKVTKYKKKIERYKKKLTKYQDQYEATEKERRKLKIEKRIMHTKKKITALVDKSNIAMRKMSRHRKFSKETYELAQNEPAYSNPKIKNKKWLALDGKKGRETASAEELFEGADDFSVSIWFRTTTNQEDKRLFNFNLAGGHSGLLLTVKKGKVVLGFRDESKKYITLEHPHKYDDNNWNNLVGTYDGQTFKFYLNGELVKSKDSTFAGFGAGKTNFGSYQQKSNFFHGDLDEASIWSEAMDEEAVAALYNDGIPTKLNRHVSSEALLKWWRMGDRVSRGIAGKLDE